ncbi:MAG: hypothetical protein ACJ741_04350 [Pyrinomonadaceae bacterium]
MKLSQGKIRDFVEPQAYDEVHDFASDPARALAAYRFTDATSDLLARWLDALADLQRGRGAARALAGLRGVGKSHTLAAFAAIVSSATLRTTLSDAHVATSARRLTSRRYTVVRVERGTSATLGEELAEAFAKAFGGQPSEWSGDEAQALAHAAERARGSTLVLVFDTAYGRATRVSRDDGPALGAIAVAAQDLDAFVALALDDDIAGAEGANVALSQTFRIDYLEPEHLYQVADNYLLRKPAGARDRLHEIYLALRQTITHFNWSEPRFAALYPVHPLVAEVAASVRLHAQTFAFLPFAAQAAQRAVNRPSLSLVLLDEVFDHTEKELRGAKDLHEAFAAYDDLTAKAVAQFPPLQRLQVRLVLKNLFILSLDGRGATARDLVAGMLLHEDSPEQSALLRVEDTLRRLAEAAPPGTLVKANDGEATCYRFLVGAHGGFDAALAKAVKHPLEDPRAISRLLDSLAHSRFEDYPRAADAADATAPPATQGDAHADSPFAVVWRGSTRAGRIVRQSRGESPVPDGACDEHDWELFVLEPGEDASAFAERLDAAGAEAREDGSGALIDGAGVTPPPIRIVWQPAEMTAEEYSLLRRLHALRTDPTLAGFGEAARVATNTLSARAERVWARLYMDDGVLVANGSPAQLAGARSATTLAALLSEALAPLFDARFPSHPLFDAALYEQDAARLVGEFFSGANTSEAGVQRLAEQFAQPLGLAVPRGNAYAHASCDEALAAPWVAATLALVESGGSVAVPIEEVRRALARAPFGLVRESQHLVAAALVACGSVELVTRSGGLISRRTLGRAVDWDEIGAVCRASGVHLGVVELTDWARRLTAREDLPQITDAAGRAEVRAALANWLAAWRATTVLVEFERLPDSGLTTRAGDLASCVRRTFAETADALESSLGGESPLEDILQRVADTFASSSEEHASAAAQLDALTVYVAGVARRETTRDYLVLAEPTGVEEIECARRELLGMAEDPHTLFDADCRARFDLLWRAFRERYAAHYAAAHDAAVGARRDAAALEQFLRSPSWREFEALASLPFIDPLAWCEASRLAARALGSRCALPVRDLLDAAPRCACPFRLADAEEQSEALARLAELTARGRAIYRRALSHYHAHVARSLEALASAEPRVEVGARAVSLAHSFARGENPPHLSATDASLIARALDADPAPPPVVRLAPPDVQGLLTREEAAARVGQWLEELPPAPALVEINGATSLHAAETGS